MTQCVNQKVMTGEHMAIRISQPTTFKVAYNGWMGMETNNNGFHKNISSLIIYLSKDV